MYLFVWESIFNTMSKKSNDYVVLFYQCCHREKAWSVASDKAEFQLCLPLTAYITFHLFESQLPHL